MDGETFSSPAEDAAGAAHYPESAAVGAGSESRPEPSAPQLVCAAQAFLGRTRFWGAVTITLEWPHVTVTGKRVLLGVYWGRVIAIGVLFMLGFVVAFLPTRFGLAEWGAAVCWGLALLLWLPGYWAMALFARAESVTYPLPSEVRVGYSFRLTHLLALLGSLAVVIFMIWLGDTGRRVTMLLREPGDTTSMPLTVQVLNAREAIVLASLLLDLPPLH